MRPATLVLWIGVIALVLSLPFAIERQVSKAAQNSRVEILEQCTIDSYRIIIIRDKETGDKYLSFNRGLVPLREVPGKAEAQ